MALALTLLADDPDTSNLSAYTTPAVTPAGNSGLIIVVGHTGTTVPNPPTLDSPTWLSGAWTQEFTQGSGTQGLTVFSGKAVASPGSDDVTATFGEAQGGCIIHIVQVTGQDATDFTRQPNGASGSGATSATVTLAGALAAATSRVFGCVYITLNSAITPNDGETELADSGHNSPTRRLQSQHKLNDTSSQFAFSSATYRAIALEIVEAQPSITAPFIAATGSPFAASVSAAGFTVNIAAPFVAATGGPLAAALNPSGSVNIPVPFVAATGSVFVPAVNVTGSVNIVIPFVAATGAAFVPALNATGAVNIVAPFIAATGAVFTPAIPLEVLAPFIAATGSTFDPVLDPGNLDVPVSFIAATGGTFGPTFSPTGSVNLDVPFVAATGGAFDPSVAPSGAAPIVAPFISSTTVVYVPVIPTVGMILAPFIASVTVLYDPASFFRMEFIDAPFIDVSGAAHDPTFGPTGSVQIDPPFVAETGTAYDPALDPSGSAPLPAPYIGTVAEVFAPAISLIEPAPIMPSLAGARTMDSTRSGPGMTERRAGVAMSDSTG